MYAAERCARVVGYDLGEVASSSSPYKQGSVFLGVLGGGRRVVCIDNMVQPASCL